MTRQSSAKYFIQPNACFTLLNDFEHDNCAKMNKEISGVRSFGQVYDISQTTVKAFDPNMDSLAFHVDVQSQSAGIRVST